MKTDAFKGAFAGNTPNDARMPPNRALRREPFWLVWFPNCWELAPLRDAKTGEAVPLKSSEDVEILPIVTVAHHVPGVEGFRQGKPGHSAVDTVLARQGILDRGGIVLPDNLPSTLGPLLCFGKEREIRTFTVIHQGQDGGQYYTTPWSYAYRNGDGVRVAHDRVGWNALRRALIKGTATADPVLLAPSLAVLERLRARQVNRRDRYEQRPDTAFTRRGIQRADLNQALIADMIAAGQASDLELFDGEDMDPVAVDPTSDVDPAAVQAAIKAQAKAERASTKAST